MKRAPQLLAVLLANLAVWPAVWFAATEPAATGAIASGRDSNRPAGALSDQPQLGEVLDFSHISPVQAYSRPLFDRSRRAWEPPPPPEPPPEEVVEPVFEPQPAALPPPAVKLVGVSVLGAKDIRALVQVDAYPEPIWVFVGDDLMGWRVGRIDTRSITIRRGKDRISFELYPEAGGSQ